MARVTPRNCSPLDGTIARLAALAVPLGVVALLIHVHRERIFPPDPAAVAADDPAALCFVERANGGIDAMLAEGAIGDQQAALFKTRAEAFCQAQAGKISGPPPLPGSRPQAGHPSFRTASRRTQLLAAGDRYETW